MSFSSFDWNAFLSLQCSDNKADEEFDKAIQARCYNTHLAVPVFFSFSNGDIIPFPHIGGVIVAAIYLTFSVLRMWLF